MQLADTQTIRLAWKWGWVDRLNSDIAHYTTFTNFSMKYHLMCKVYTDVGGIK